MWTVVMNIDRPKEEDVSFDFMDAVMTKTPCHPNDKGENNISANQVS